MNEVLERPVTVFEGSVCLAAGSLREVLPIVQQAHQNALGRADAPALLVIDDAVGGVIDLDLRGSIEAVTLWLAATGGTPAPLTDGFVDEAGGAAASGAEAVETPSYVSRTRGRPRLGVVAREVTLLPRHWEWLASQRGGASVALRRLIDEARRANSAIDARRSAHERAYRFMTLMAGDLPGFEESIRALFADDAQSLGALIDAWPADVRNYAVRLAFGD